MKLYLVREAETTKIHGIFWATNPTGLWDAVDEMADPFDFEWAEIRSFGGVWREGKLADVLPLPDRRQFPDTADGAFALDQAFAEAVKFGFSGFSDHLLNMIASQDEHAWTRFDAANEGVGVIARALRACGRA